MDQPQLFGDDGDDGEQRHPGDVARDEAIDRVEANADRDWYDRAVLAVLNEARRRERLTSIDCQEAMPDAPREPRVWGAVMREAQREGWVARGGVVDCKRERSHSRPVRQWISRVYAG